MGSTLHTAIYRSKKYARPLFYYVFSGAPFSNARRFHSTTLRQNHMKGHTLKAVAQGRDNHTRNAKFLRRSVVYLFPVLVAAGGFGWFEGLDCGIPVGGVQAIPKAPESKWGTGRGGGVGGLERYYRAPRTATPAKRHTGEIMTHYL